MNQNQAEREVLNTLATMPEHSTATILDVKVERFITGYFVNGSESTYTARGAAKLIAKASKAETYDLVLIDPSTLDI